MTLREKMQAMREEGYSDIEIAGSIGIGELSVQYLLLSDDEKNFFRLRNRILRIQRMLVAGYPMLDIVQETGFSESAILSIAQENSG